MKTREMLVMGLLIVSAMAPTSSAADEKTRLITDAVDARQVVGAVRAEVKEGVQGTASVSCGQFSASARATGYPASAAAAMTVTLWAEADARPGSASASAWGLGGGWARAQGGTYAVYCDTTIIRATTDSVAISWRQTATAAPTCTVGLWDERWVVEDAAATEAKIFEETGVEVAIEGCGIEIL